MSVCTTCLKCPQCCLKSGCRGQVTEVLASMAQDGCKSTAGFDFERGIHATLQKQTPSELVPLGQEWLCSPGEKQVPKRSTVGSQKQVGSRRSGCAVVPGLLQQTFSGPKAQQQVETNFGSQQIKSVSAAGHLQDGNSRKHTGVPEKRRMGKFAGFQRCLFPHSHRSEISKVPQIFSGKEILSVHCPPFRSGYSSSIVYQGSQGGETYGSDTGYPAPPVPRRLVTESPVPGNLPTTYPDPLGPLPRLGLGSKPEEVRTGSPASLQFYRLPVRPSNRSGFAHSGKVVCPATEIKGHKKPEHILLRLKYVRAVSSVDQLAFVNMLQMSQLGTRHGKFWETWQSLSAGLKIGDLMRATLSPLDPAQLDKVTDHHKHYVKSPQGSVS